MIVGGYTLHLYCDNEYNHNISDYSRVHWGVAGKIYFEEIAGTDEHDCRRQAKRKGWGLRGLMAYCPLCGGKQREGGGDGA